MDMVKDLCRAILQSHNQRAYLLDNGQAVDVVGCEGWENTTATPALQAFKKARAKGLVVRDEGVLWKLSPKGETLAHS